jgi:hypothetical protein
MIGRRLRHGISFADLALGVAFVVFAARALLMPARADTYWHLRVGADVLRLHAVPRVELYSFTAAGHPWREHEWLWDPISYLCYRLGGMPLYTVCGAALVTAALVLVYRLMKGPVWTRLLLMTTQLVLVAPLWVLRPQLFTLLAVPLLVTWLARGRHWPIPPLFALWANVHGAVALGGVVLGVATALALLRWRIRRTPEDRRRAIALAVVLPASGAACLLTPLGTGIFHFLADSMMRIRAVGIAEWQPTRLGHPYGAIFWIAALALVGLVVVRRRELRDGGRASSWADWMVVAVALALVPLAAAAVRNVGVFALVAVPAASCLLGPDARIRLPWRRAREPRADADADKPILNLILLAGFSLGALAFVARCYSQNLPMLDWRPIDGAAQAALRACDGPLYNQYDEGGYLIWFVPEKPVFVDNRQDPYPLAHIQAQLEVQWGAAPYRALFDRWGIRCAFLPAASPTIAALDRDGWITRHRDERYAVLAAPASSARHE